MLTHDVAMSHRWHAGYDEDRGRQKASQTETRIHASVLTGIHARVGCSCMTHCYSAQLSSLSQFPNPAAYTTLSSLKVRSLKPHAQAHQQKNKKKRANCLVQLTHEARLQLEWDQSAWDRVHHVGYTCKKVLTAWARQLEDTCD